MPASVVCTLYKFVTLDNYQTLQEPLLRLLKENRVKGTLLLAREGINGTIAGAQNNIETVLSWLQSDPRLNPLSYKLSHHNDAPFLRTRVKLKREIVTMGVEKIDPKKTVGTYVKPDKWNDLISSSDVLVIDTRNEYEVAIGSFKHAVNPNTQTFREFPDYAKKTS